MNTLVNLDERVYKERFYEEMNENEAAELLGCKSVNLAVISFGNSTISYCAKTENDKYILIEFNPLKRDESAYQNLLNEFMKYHPDIELNGKRKVEIVNITGYFSISELHDEGTLSFSQAEMFMDEVIKIHNKGMLHLGIAPYNVLFKGNKCIVINNDSLVSKSEIEKKKAKYFSVTPFSAPELRMKSCEKIDEQTDVYSVCFLLKHFFNLDEHHMETLKKGLQHNVMKRYANLTEFKLALAEE